MIYGGTPGLRFLRWQQRRKPLPLLVCQFVSAYHVDQYTLRSTGLHTHPRVAELDGLSRQSDLRLKDLEEQLDASRFDLQVECDESIKSAHERVVKVFSSVVTCAAIWDITDYEEIDPTVTRSNAQAAVARRPVHFGFRQPEFIDYAGRVPFMQNANGSDLYFYPGFLLLVSNDATLALVDPTELDVEFVTATTREEEGVPNDALVIGQTWAKENKDGSPDRRFAGNYQIPLVSYGMLKLRSNAGLNEWYLLSDVKKAEDLGEALQQYATSQV